MSKSVRRVRAALEEAGVAPDIREMPEETRTARQAADAIGCELDQIAKSIVFHAPVSDRITLFVTAGGNQVDPDLAAMAAGEELARADAAIIRARTGFVIGGVAPIGHLESPAVYFDRRLLDFDVVWAAAGTPRHVFSADPQVLKVISAAQDAEFTSLSE